jgi:hypothetical protein
VTSYTLRTVDSNGRRGTARTVSIAPPPRTAPPTTTGDTAGYPEDGTVDDVLTWVDNADTPDRAKAAIVAEHGRDHPRKTLLAKLNERTG